MKIAFKSQIHQQVMSIRFFFSNRKTQERIRARKIEACIQIPFYSPDLVQGREEEMCVLLMRGHS